MVHLSRLLFPLIIIPSSFVYGTQKCQNRFLFTSMLFSAQQGQYLKIEPKPDGHEACAVDSLIHLKSAFCTSNKKD